MGLEPSPLGTLELGTEPGPLCDAAIEPRCHQPAPWWDGRPGGSWRGADQPGGLQALVFPAAPRSGPALGGGAARRLCSALNPQGRGINLLIGFAVVLGRCFLQQRRCRYRSRECQRSSQRSVCDRGPPELVVAAVPDVRWGPARAVPRKTKPKLREIFACGG